MILQFLVLSWFEVRFHVDLPTASSMVPVKGSEACQQQGPEVIRGPTVQQLKDMKKQFFQDL